MSDHYEDLVEMIGTLIKRIEIFEEEVQYKFDIVFDELYAIRTELRERKVPES
jgi:hypothetical protein